MPVREGERPQQCTIYIWINVMDIFYYALLSVDEFKMFFVFINAELLILKYITYIKKKVHFRGPLFSAAEVNVMPVSP